MYTLYTLAGKVIAGPADDTGENLAWVVSDDHAPSLVEVARVMRHFNNRHVRITIEAIPEPK